MTFLSYYRDNWEQILSKNLNLQEEAKGINKVTTGQLGIHSIKDVIRVRNVRKLPYFT